MSSPKAIFSLFPKHYQGVDARETCERTLACGFEGIDVIVREGFWCEPGNMAATVPRMATLARASGLAVPVAVIPQTAGELAANPEPLAILADAGIAEFRFGYFRQGLEDPRARLREARRDLALLAERCQGYKMRGWLQLHHGTLHPSPSAAWSLVETLPPSAIGIQIDPGNQSHEGFEWWTRSVRLLGSHLAAVGVKDTRPERKPDGSGWSRPWVMLEEGATNWTELLGALKSQAFRGVFDFQPHYLPDAGGEGWKNLRRDLEFLKKLWATATLPK